MRLFDVFDVAGTALSAQSVRLNITSSNLANQDSVSSSISSTYRARHPVFQTIMDDFNRTGAVAGGVMVKGIVESQTPLQEEYQPQHPMANEEGYIYKPNVNAIEEMANMISASRSYQNNVEVINASKEMLLRTLSMGQ